MKEKSKNSQQKSWVGQVVLMLTVLGIAFLCFVSFPIWGFMAADLLEEMQERPIVQAAVREQCNIPNYLADGSFDILDHDYFDLDLESGEPEIACSGIEWQCTCN